MLKIVITVFLSLLALNFYVIICHYISIRTKCNEKKLFANTTDIVSGTERLFSFIDNIIDNYIVSEFKDVIFVNNIGINPLSLDNHIETIANKVYNDLNIQRISSYIDKESALKKEAILQYIVNRTTIKVSEVYAQIKNKK